MLTLQTLFMIRCHEKKYQVKHDIAIFTCRNITINLQIIFLIIWKPCRINRYCTALVGDREESFAKSRNLRKLAGTAEDIMDGAAYVIVDRNPGTNAGYAVYGI